MIIDSHHKNSYLIRENVEIVISSNDYQEYKKINIFSENNLKFYNPRIVTPYKNINGDNNIASAASLSYGKYVWILCDDDLCSLYSIEYILHSINQYNFSLLYLEPLIIDPNKLKSNYNVESLSLNFNTEALEQLKINNSIPNSCEIDEIWLSKNITNLLRASSLVFSREKTHRYWTSMYYKNGNNIASFCISLDALCGGLSIRSINPVYIYIDANKESWSKSWLYIYYFELIPLAKIFLKEKNIDFNLNDFKIQKKDYISLIPSMIYNWRKILNVKNIVQLSKYLFK
jgi:hypothetical protein